jgi:sulfur carrier protein ThiS adenylyltransferase
VPGTFARLQECTVGVLGSGGLGSHVAAALVRSGVGHLILADPDRVEISNLNRQLFFCDQVGLFKVEALAQTLRRITPFVRLSLHAERITPAKLTSRLGGADLLIEALDAADEKARLIESWLLQQPEKYIVCASGLGGYGRSEDLLVRRMGRLILCGDGTRDARSGLSAGRVGAVAHLQANLAVELLMEG